MGRTPQEDIRIEHRRQQVAEWILQSWTQGAMARELGVSQATISSDLKAIRKEWRDSRVRDFDEAVDLALQKHHRVEREAWAAWKRSQLPAETTRVTQNGENKRAEKTVRQQPGDVHFLVVVNHCITACRRLLGLDAPTRIAPTSPDGKEAYDAHVMTELMRIAAETKEGPTIIDEQHIKRLLQNQPDGPAGQEDPLEPEDNEHDS